MALPCLKYGSDVAIVSSRGRCYALPYGQAKPLEAEGKLRIFRRVQHVPGTPFLTTNETVEVSIIHARDAEAKRWADLQRAGG